MGKVKNLTDSDFDTTIGAAKHPVLIDFSASWCGPCQAMKKNVYPSAEVQAYHDKFVWAYLDVDDKNNKKVASEFKVSGIPHIEFLSADGKELDKQVGGNQPAAFAKKLETVLKAAGGAEKADDKKEEKTTAAKK